MQLPPVKRTYREFRSEDRTRVCSLLLTAAFSVSMVGTALVVALKERYAV